MAASVSRHAPGCRAATKAAGGMGAGGQEEGQEPFGLGEPAWAKATGPTKGAGGWVDGTASGVAQLMSGQASSMRR